jgi:hypothetical protein
VAKKKEKKKRINILTVCGVGSGSSLILRMYVEDVLEEFGLRYKVSTSHLSACRQHKRTPTGFHPPGEGADAGLRSGRVGGIRW